MLKVLIDGIFFRINNTGIARVWQSIIPILANKHGIQLYILDRGGIGQINSATLLPFPTTSFNGSAVFNYCADDSFLIQKICDQYEIDVFTSTFFTSPISTPMLLMMYDMIPELFLFTQHTVWMEKEMAICFAQRYLCISESTKNDMLSFYPEIPSDRVAVAYCGVDTEAFRPRGAYDIEQFCRAHGLTRPYYLFVGSRVQHTGYKNSSLFFDAIRSMRKSDFDVLCVGGEREIEGEVLRSMPEGVRCLRIDLSDDELSLAYSGAIALVYPSLYEGFGMPVIEAMACGCPVITTRMGALAEAGGDAACVISGFSTEEMLDALKNVRLPGYREEFIDRGIKHAENFRWEKMADKVATDIKLLAEENRAGTYDAFFAEWRKHRAIQASVDFEWTPPTT